MKVKEVLMKYHGIVPFPWTPAKLKKAGFDPMVLCRNIGQEIGECVDRNEPSAKATLEALKDLEVMP